MGKRRQRGGASLYFVLALNLLLVGFFALQFNTFLNTSFNLQRHKELTARLDAKNEEKSLTFVSKNKAENIEELAREMDFKKAEDVEYINILEKEVAAKTE